MSLYCATALSASCSALKNRKTDGEIIFLTSLRLCGECFGCGYAALRL
jgi:hypothetical protein